MKIYASKRQGRDGEKQKVQHEHWTFYIIYWYTIAIRILFSD